MDQKDRINEIIKEAEKGKNKDKEKSKIVKEFLIITIDSYYFALQIEYLREVFDIINKNEIVHIPFTPDYIMGIINVRGEILPALSLLRLLGIEDKNFNIQKIAIIDEKFKIACPFTDIIVLKTIDISNIKTIKNASREIKDQFVTQEFEYENQLIGIIDILKLYSSEYLL